MTVSATTLSTKWRFTLRFQLASLITILIGAIALSIFFYLPSRLEKQAMVAIADKAQSIAEMTAFSVSAPLIFEDIGAIEEAFEGVKQNEDLVSIVVIDAAGAVFATFSNGDADSTTLEKGPIENGVSTDGMTFNTMAPILHNREEIGKLYLGLSLAKLRTEIGKNRIAVATVSLAIFLFGMLAVYRITLMVGRLESTHFELEGANRSLEKQAGELQAEIDERKRIEAELKFYAEKLERSNSELQDFAYVASHDLQEPLRKIQAFGDRLKSRCGESLDNRGQDYIVRMQNAAGRMQGLITDLLAFSRVTTEAQPFTRVDLTQIAREVVSDLEIRIEETGGAVEIGDLPTIDVEPLHMRQLLQNLIGNALKFCREDVPPVVQVKSLFGGDETCEIHVEDNGIGFDEKYVDRIFSIFQRLHGHNTYEGTGVGLAICRKIVERHRGEITAKSTPGEGTTFIITLPIQHDEGDDQ